MTSGERDIKDAETSFKQLDGFFAGRRLSAIESSAMTSYIGSGKLKRPRTGRSTAS